MGAFYSESKQRYTALSITTFHNILAAFPPETLDNAIRQWTGQHGTAHAPVAMDGKDLRGASKQTNEGRRMIVAAVEHGTGLVLGQKEIDDKTNEVPVVRDLSSGLHLAGRAGTRRWIPVPAECESAVRRVRALPLTLSRQARGRDGSPPADALFLIPLLTRDKKWSCSAAWRVGNFVKMEDGVAEMDGMEFPLI